MKSKKFKVKQIKIKVLHPHRKPIVKAFRGPATVKDILRDSEFRDLVPPKAKVLVLHEPPPDMPLPPNAALVVVPAEPTGFVIQCGKRNIFCFENIEGG